MATHEFVQQAESGDISPNSEVGKYGARANDIKGPSSSNIRCEGADPIHASEAYSSIGRMNPL